MPAEIILLVREGGVPWEKELSFKSPGTCLVGRAPDADVQVTKNGACFVSRHHCLFEIVPPRIRVRDLGSLNGTFVNGRIIALNSRRQKIEGARPQEAHWHELHAGDVVSVGALQIRVVVLFAGSGTPEDYLIDGVHSDAGLAAC